MLSAWSALEGNLLLLIQQWVRCPPLSAVLVPLTIFGGCGTMWICISVALILRPRSRKAGWMALLALLLCYLFNDHLLKALVQRPRPFLTLETLEPLVRRPTSFSFPSGHSCSSFAAAHTYSLALDSRAFRAVTMALAVLMAFSRLYVGVHYPTDVLVGALTGFFGSALVWKLFSPVYDNVAARLRRSRADSE